MEFRCCRSKNNVEPNGQDSALWSTTEPLVIENYQEDGMCGNELASDRRWMGYLFGCLNILGLSAGELRSSSILDHLKNVLSVFANDILPCEGGHWSNKLNWSPRALAPPFLRLFST